MQDRIVSPKEVRHVAGDKSRSTIWRWVRAGIFPKPLRVGPNSIGWLESEIEGWLEARKADAEESTPT